MKEATEIDRQIGSRIRSRRAALGLSQEKLADALGLTFQQVQKYEKGTNRVAASRLLAIAHVLGVQVGLFYEGLDAQDGGIAKAFDVEIPTAFARFAESTEFRQVARAFEPVVGAATRQRVVGILQTACRLAVEGQRATPEEAQRHLGQEAA